MTAEGFWAETWKPGNRLGFVTSITSVLFLAIFFWWFGVIDTCANLATTSAIEIVGAVLIGGGTLAIHARPRWRERWRTRMQLRAVVSIPIVVITAVLLVFNPPVVPLSFLVMAGIFIPGRAYLYFAA